MALEAPEALGKRCTTAHVIFRPWVEVFCGQDGGCRDSVPTPAVERVVIEAATKAS